jgi:predicted metal-dependent HD superfamily phosphohydrolase
MMEVRVPTEVSERWARFWEGLGAMGEPGPIYQDLARRYAEPQRAYHTLRHIEECLREFEPARSLARDERAVEMAIWYHDAVYRPRSHDNEKRSAALAGKVAALAGLSPHFADKVEALILATRHKEVPRDTDAQLLTDIDLAILGHDKHRFEEYERQIRREYRCVPGPIYKSKRSAILQRLLMRPTIYSTPYFKKRYEARARENLKRTVEA